MSSKIGPFFLLLGSILLPSIALDAQDQKSRKVDAVPIVTLEVAPGELGAVRSEKGLLIASASKGREIFLFDKSTGQLRVYLESGDLWRKAATLSDLHGQPF